MTVFRDHYLVGGMDRAMRRTFAGIMSRRTAKSIFGSWDAIKAGRRR